MPLAVELFLDQEADRRIREIWAALDARGITSLGGIPGTLYRPHVTLSVFERGDPARVAAALRPLLNAAIGLELPLSPLGFFLTDEAPAFLGVIPSARLLGLHHAVDQAIEPLVDDIWPYYRPDALLPHCTLAMAVTDKATTIRTVSGFRTPVPARVAGAHLVEIPGGHTSTPLTSAG